MLPLKNKERNTEIAALSVQGGGSRYLRCGVQCWDNSEYFTAFKADIFHCVQVSERG